MKDLSLPLAVQLRMDVLHGEYAELNSRWNAANIISPYTRVYLVTAGCGFLKDPNTTLPLSPGYIYVIPAGLKTAFGCNTFLNKTYFHLSIPLPNGNDLMENLHTCLMFQDCAAVEEITGCVKNPTAKHLLRIQAFLYDLVFKCLSNMEDVEIESYSDYISAAIKYIDKNLSATLTLPMIAEALSTSSEKLRKTFRAETGISLGKYIDNRIMRKAVLELQKGQHSIKEISDKLGFCDQFYFSRCFTKRFGMPPRVYAGYEKRSL